MSTKTVLITGASTGFGRDTAETLAHAGHHVFATMRDIKGKNHMHAEALLGSARSDKLHLEVLELDVTSDASVDQAINSIIKTAGRIDVLVNNAGIASAGVSEAFTPGQLQSLFDVNVIGVHRVTRAVLPTLRKQKDGLVINIGSILGRVTFPFFGLYGASKFALEALTESYRYELSQLGVDVVLVQPSAYPTPMYSNVLQPADSARAAGYGPVGEIPGAMFQHFMKVFQSADAPNPHDVARTILALVDAPKGGRTIRAIVGAPFGSDAVNTQTAPVQAQVVAGLGLGHLDKAAA